MGREEKHRTEWESEMPEQGHRKIRLETIYVGIFF